MTSLARRVHASRAALAAVTALALATLPQRAVGAPAGPAVSPPTGGDIDATEAQPAPVDPDADVDVDAGPDEGTVPAADPAVDPPSDPEPDPGPGRSSDQDDAAVVDTGTLDDRDGADEPAAPDPVEPADAAIEADARGDDELPELSTLQKAGWWTLFGAFAVGTTAGVFAGLAERQEDRALRLATLFDSTNGAQPLYESHREDYEQYLRRGRAFERTAIGLGAVTGAVLVAGIVLFAVDAARRRTGDRDRRRAHVQPGPGGWEVRF